MWCVDCSPPNPDLNQWLATGMVRLNSNLDEILDLDAGLANAQP
jgi:hypothetical protein